ncbi:hypothetical protein Q0812_12830 [Brevundimonas sp. 2R-24]|uniref:Lipoprotein n=1 Tax=Peiella sedimenti TaxID=3061083 RepID=A0ABT8SQH3_9CAUL|nr:hypothetical protein [Caulobacteraceae bacterium XZ-24]
MSRIGVITALSTTLTLAGCQPAQPDGAGDPAPTPAEDVTQPLPALSAPAWFICDAINQPVVLIAEQPVGDQVRIRRIDKTAPDRVTAQAYELGAEEGAAGSVFRSLTLDGAEAGHIRRLSVGVLADPNSATTPPVTSVRLADQELECRWLANTRLMAVTGHRTVLITDEAGSGLVFRSFNFADADTAQPVRPDGGQRSSTPSLELRGGEVMGTGAADSYLFPRGRFTYVINAARDGTGTVEIRRGAEVEGTDPILALELGAGR